MISLINVKKRYNNKMIFDDVNLNIDKSGLYLIRGDNGVGKSTLLNIIGGFTSVKGKVINQYRKEMGYVFQNNFLINELKVKDNLKAFEIQLEVLDEYGMESKIDEYVYNLSTGERQRLAFIIATREKNKLILLDEVFANLDEENEKIILNKINQLKKEKIIILVSHKYERIKEHVDYVINIKNNKITLKCINDGEKVETKTRKSCKSPKIKAKLNFKLCICYFIFLFLFTILTILANITSLLINNDIKNSLDYNKFYLKECTPTYDNILSVSQCSNPSEEKLKHLNSNGIEYGFNYDYLLMNVYNDERLAVINNNDVILSSGRYPNNYNEVIANHSFKLNDTITLKSNLVIGNDKIDIYDEELTLTVVGIYNDLFFMNQDKLYFDYKYTHKYYSEKILENNGISLYSYFYNLDIENYKYISFTNKFIDNVKFEGATYSYYQGIRDILDKVDDLLMYIKVGIIISTMYLLIKIYRGRLVELQKSVSFLIANSYTKKGIILCYLKKDFIAYVSIFIFFFFVGILLKLNFYDLLGLIMFFVVNMVTLLVLVLLYFSRKNISKLMLEEVW